MVLEGIPRYHRELRSILQKYHVGEVVIQKQLDELALNPRNKDKTNVVSLGEYNLRKTRINIPGKTGTREFRLYYYVTNPDSDIVPVYIHDKSQEKRLSNKKLKSLAKEIKRHLANLQEK